MNFARLKINLIEDSKEGPKINNLIKCFSKINVVLLGCAQERFGKIIEKLNINLA